MHTGHPLEYIHIIKNNMESTWIKSFANELGRLSIGIPYHGIIGTNTIQFIPYTSIPSSNSVTYG